MGLSKNNLLASIGKKAVNNAVLISNRGAFIDIGEDIWVRVLLNIESSGLKEGQVFVTFSKKFFSIISKLGLKLDINVDSQKIFIKSGDFDFELDGSLEDKFDFLPKVELGNCISNSGLLISYLLSASFFSKDVYIKDNLILGTNWVSMYFSRFNVPFEGVISSKLIDVLTYCDRVYYEDGNLIGVSDILEVYHKVKSGYLFREFPFDSFKAIIELEKDKIFKVVFLADDLYNKLEVISEFLKERKVVEGYVEFKNGEICYNGGSIKFEGGELKGEFSLEQLLLISKVYKGSGIKVYGFEGKDFWLFNDVFIMPVII